jgi:Fe2+ or Zn2+ uptake regulation protein
MGKITVSKIDKRFYKVELDEEMNSKLYNVALRPEKGIKLIDGSEELSKLISHAINNRYNRIALGKIKRSPLRDKILRILIDDKNELSEEEIIKRCGKVHSITQIRQSLSNAITQELIYEGDIGYVPDEPACKAYLNPKINQHTSRNWPAEILATKNEYRKNEAEKRRESILDWLEISGPMKASAIAAAMQLRMVTIYRHLNRLIAENKINREIQTDLSSIYSIIPKK